MLSTIKLYYQPVLETHEVDDELLDRLLPPELDAIQLLRSKPAPKELLCVS